MVEATNDKGAVRVRWGNETSCCRDECHGACGVRGAMTVAKKKCSTSSSGQGGRKRKTNSYTGLQRGTGLDRNDTGPPSHLMAGLKRQAEGLIARTPTECA